MLVAEDPPTPLTHTTHVHRKRLLAFIAFGLENRLSEYRHELGWETLELGDWEFGTP
jgi:hypothetical protein